MSVKNSITRKRHLNFFDLFVLYNKVLSSMLRKKYDICHYHWVTWSRANFLLPSVIKNATLAEIRVLELNTTMSRMILCSRIRIHVPGKEIKNNLGTKEQLLCNFACFWLLNELSSNSTYVYTIFHISDPDIVQQCCFIQVHKRTCKKKKYTIIYLAIIRIMHFLL